jgi:hypothetical protein
MCWLAALAALLPVYTLLVYALLLYTLLVYTIVAGGSSGAARSLLSLSLSLSLSRL